MNLMKILDFFEAKSRFSELIDRAARGEVFLIVTAEKRQVTVSAVERPAERRLGFMKGEIDVPDDFDRMPTPGMINGDPSA